MKRSGGAGGGSGCEVDWMFSFLAVTVMMMRILMGVSSHTVMRNFWRVGRFQICVGILTITIKFTS